MLERPPMQLQEVDRSTPSRSSARSTPARTIVGVIGPGFGHHLVKATSAPPPAAALARQECGR